MKKFNSLDELESEREELGKKFNGELPSYLADYFDKEVDRLEKIDFYRRTNTEKAKNTNEERYEYKKKKTEELWNENDYEIVKSLRTTPDAFKLSFDEPVRNPVQEE